MLDNIINLVKQYAGEAVNANTAIPADKKAPVIDETVSSVSGSIQNLASGGGITDLLGMFQKGGDAVPANVTQTLSGDLISNLTKKVGLDSQTAASLATGIIPQILKGLISKTNDPAEKGFDLQSMFNQLTGGKTGGLNLGGIVGKIKAGLDRDGDGDVDLQDLKKLFSK